MLRERGLGIAILCSVFVFFTTLFPPDNSFAVQKKSTKSAKHSSAVQHKKPKKKVRKKPKSRISIAPPSQMKPTMTGAPGTVKSYFFPSKIGAEWTLRTIQLLLDNQNKLLRADTIFAESRVTDTARF